MRFIKRGHKGPPVIDIQRKLKKLKFDVQDPEGSFGDSTEWYIKQFQQDRGLLVDGIVGPETWHDLVEASYKIGSRSIYVKDPLFRGDDVKTVQLWLRSLGFDPGSIDGTYGHETEKAVKEFQFNYGLQSDGIISTETIEHFLNLRTILEKNVSVEFPYYEKQQDSSLSSLENQKILLDFGHGGSDRGAIGHTGLEESDVCEDIGLRVANLFKILGTQVIYSRKPEQGRPIARRIELINNSKASLVISIHMNHSMNNKAEGSSCYFFSQGHISSVKGKKLADYIHRELIAALDLKDCRVHGKNFNILKLTKIPAVIIEPAFITNPREEVLLRAPEFRQKIATAIFDGLKRYFNEELADDSACN